MRGRRIRKAGLLGDGIEGKENRGCVPNFLKENRGCVGLLKKFCFK